MNGLRAKRAWKWFNFVSNALGWVFLLAQGCAWIGWSVHAGHFLGYREFHLLCDEAFFQFANWIGSHID